MCRSVTLALALLTSGLSLSLACQGFTAVEAYRNGPYIAFKNFLTRAGSLDFRQTFGTFRAVQKGLYFFTYTSDAPITLRKNRVVVARNFYEGGMLGSSSAVLHLVPGDIVYLYAREGPIKPFSATFSGFLIVGDKCYGGFGVDDDSFNGGGGAGGGGGGGYNGGRFPGSQVPSPAVFGRSGRGNRTSSSAPAAPGATIDVVENLGQPDLEDKILELIK